jgi:hypothetical protein
LKTRKHDATYLVLGVSLPGPWAGATLQTGDYLMDSAGRFIEQLHDMNPSLLYFEAAGDHDHEVRAWIVDSG